MKAGATLSVKVQLVPPPFWFSALVFSLSARSQAQVLFAPPLCSLPFFLSVSSATRAANLVTAAAAAFFFCVFEDADLEDEAACAAAFFHGCGGGEATPSGAVHCPGERCAALALVHSWRAVLVQDAKSRGTQPAGRTRNQAGTGRKNKKKKDKQLEKCRNTRRELR